MIQKALITGSKGQLGNELQVLAKNIENIQFYFTDLPELDITNADAISTFVTNHAIDCIINCAAYTAVDKAESEQDIAYKVNALAAENLAKVAESKNIKFIHISTDYVFDGTNYFPYYENFATGPTSVYGWTKLAGEEFVLSSKAKAIIIRTSWLYSCFGNNFVKTMLKLGREKEQIQVIFDQVGTPTYARDLAVAILNIIQSKLFFDPDFVSRIYHFSNEGVCSWYDFACSIMEIAQLNCKVLPIHSAQYKTIVQRPHYSVLDKSKIKNDLNIEIPQWRESLKDCLKVLLK